MKSRDKTRPKLYRDLLIKLASFLRLSTRDRQERFKSFAVRCLFFFSVVYSKITKQFVFRFQDNLSWSHDKMLCLIDIKADWLKLITLRATLVYQNPILINKEMQKRWVNRWEKEVWCLICDRASSTSSAPTVSIAHTSFKKKTIAQISFSQSLALGDSWFHFGRVANIMDYVFLLPWPAPGSQIEVNRSRGKWCEKRVGAGERDAYFFFPDILLFFARGSILVWLWFDLSHVFYFQNYSLLAYKPREFCWVEHSKICRHSHCNQR